MGGSTPYHGKLDLFTLLTVVDHQESGAAVTWAYHAIRYSNEFGSHPLLESSETGESRLSLRMLFKGDKVLLAQ